MAARSLNKVLLIGNLTRDPELRYTPKGTAVCTFGLATNRSWTPADGSDRQEETEFHRIVAWSKLAEICSQLLYKGRRVYVEGRLQTRTWEGQDGQERTTTEVVIDSMIALGPPKEVTADVDAMAYEGNNEAYVDETQASGEEPAVEEAAPAVKQPATKKETVKKKTAKKSDDKTFDDSSVADDIPF